jgi:hypothetical protein
MKNFIKKLLTEALMGEDYPSDFSMDKFKTLSSFKDRIRYCQNTLQRISSGSSRIVYKIDDTKVLKLAKNRKGLAQCEVEADYSKYKDINAVFAKTFDYEENHLWIEMELALPVKENDFQRIIGFSFKDYCAAINNYGNAVTTPSKRSYEMPIDKLIVARMWEDEFVFDMFQYIGNYDIPVGDLKRLNSYGIVKRDGADAIVLIDFGITQGVNSSYY